MTTIKEAHTKYYNRNANTSSELHVGDNIRIRLPGDLLWSLGQCRSYEVCTIPSMYLDCLGPLTDAELGLEGYVIFRKEGIGSSRGGVLLYIKETISAYEVHLQEEADCNEAIWCKLVTGHTTFTIGVVYSCPNITNQNIN